MTDAEIIAATERLYQLLYHATDLQWQRPPVQHADKVGGRSFGVSDPTAETALDQTRLDLRAQVLVAGATVSGLVAALESALDDFNSHQAD